MANSAPEPWLRGPIAGVSLLVMPVLFSFAQVREDLAVHVAGRFNSEEVWRRIGGSSLGFHLKHMAGSVDRLSTYLAGGQLTEKQLTFLTQESSGIEGVTELLRQLEESLGRCAEQLRNLDPNTLYEPRTVGRQSFPTTVIGLVIHLAEHTQRHLGQAITLSKILRQPT